VARKLLVSLIVIMAGIYIFWIPHEPIGFKILMKLIPMALILIFAISTKTFLPSSYKGIILFGLFVCMIADGVIYWFMAGLITFFIGHLFYIFAFRQLDLKPMPIWIGLLLNLYGASMAVWIAGSQFAIGEYVLGGAIIAYILLIMIMAWLAIRTRIKLAIIGALLFILSDSILAIDRFVEDILYRDAFVMITYFAAQLFIAASIGSRFVKYSINAKSLIR
jgi:alkenylglycerophosphocholine/alkenylglycerophosphoethanolamine hydrolase